jgi:hypothetical protein
MGTPDLAQDIRFELLICTVEASPVVLKVFDAAAPDEHRRSVGPPRLPGLEEAFWFLSAASKLSGF